MIMTRNEISKILIVDDDENFAAVLCNLVEISGVQASSARGAREALDCINNEQGYFDMIITDYEMPKMNGIELARIVRKKFPEVIIVGMSGHMDVRNDFIDAGANSFLEKPFRPDQLIKLINEVPRT
jgi:DNA-binding NtrC family response regulator